jgi:hypothetical protein
MRPITISADNLRAGYDLRFCSGSTTSRAWRCNPFNSVSTSITSASVSTFGSKAKAKGNGKADKPFVLPPSNGPAIDDKRGAAWAAKARARP